MKGGGVPYKYLGGSYKYFEPLQIFVPSPYKYVIDIRVFGGNLHIYSRAGGNLKTSEGIGKFPEGEARGKFSNSRGCFQIPDVEGIYVQIPDKNPNI